MTKYLAIALLGFLTSLVGSVDTAFAQTWVTNGPYGGSIPVLAVDPTTPTTIFAGTSGSGIFKSTNGGGNWIAISNGLLGNFVIDALAIDPFTPMTIYAGTDGGLFRSTDGGANWSYVTMTVFGVAICEGVISVVAIDPKTPTTIYAASPNAGVCNGGLFKSTDGGASWTAIDQGLPTYGNSKLPWVSAFVIDPVTPTSLYAAAVPSGPGNISDIFRSTDGGASWTSATTGQAGTYVSSLAIAPTTPTSTLYATLNPATGGGLGVFKSTDGGASWSNINNGLIWAVAVDPAVPTTLYAGSPAGSVSKSTDGGATWATITSPTGQFGQFVSIFVFAKNPPNPSTVYVGGAMEGGGVFKTTDGGASWSAVSSGLTRTSVSILAIDPTTPTTIYAGTNDGGGGGVFKSVDGGGTWTAAGSGLPTTTLIAASSLVIDPSTPSTLYIAGNGNHGGTVGVFKSTDGGGSWNAVNTGLPSFVNALAIDPVTPTTVYVGTDSGVFKSTNGAGSWTAVNTGLTVNGSTPIVSALAVDPSTSTTIYALTFQSGSDALFKSTNGGGSWSAVNTTVTGNPVPPSTEVLAVDPATPTTIYYIAVGSGSSLLKSTDGGTSWSTFNIPATIVDALVIDPATPTTLYAGVPGGVLESTDGGQTWSTIDAGFTQNNVQALAVDTKGLKIFGGTSGGVFSTTAGQSVGQTTTTLVSSPNPSAPGQTVTLSATVTSPSGTPTGTVLFTHWTYLYANDGTLFGCCYELPSGMTVVQLSAGVASLSVSSLAIGSQIFNATYQPDSITFAPSTSAFLTQTVTPPPIANVAPTSLTFAAETIGTASASQPVTLNNTGNSALAVSGISVSGEFGQNNTCGGSVAANSSCTINVTFTPTAAGTRTGTLTITDNNNLVSGSKQTVNLTGTGNNPAPTITSISPTSATAGGAAFTLTVNGTGFLSTSVVNFGANARATTFVSATQLTAAILASDITSAGSFPVTVTNSAPGGGTSASATFTVSVANNPVPTLTSISPTSATAGGAAFALTLTGTNFIASSTVNFGANPGVTPTSQTSTQLQVMVPAADIATASVVNVTVTNPAPGGGTTSAQTYTINNPVPTISSLSPSRATADGAAFTLTINGTNFVSGTTGAFNGNVRTVTFVSSTQVTMAVTAADSASVGTFNVTVTNPAPGGGMSNAINFAVTDFSIAAASGGSASATVTAGQAATYNLQVTPSNGFTGSVTLTCSGAPNLAICTPTPSSLAVNGTPTPFTVSVTTTAPSIAGLLAGGTASASAPLGDSIAALLSVALVTGLAGLTLATRRPQRALAPVLALLALALFCGCGGGSPNPTPTPVGGTPKGTYTLTVTGASGAANRTMQLTLTVN